MKLYTVAQAADMLQCSRRYIRSLCARGRLGCKVGQIWVIAGTEIAALQEKQTHPQPGMKNVLFSTVEAAGELGLSLRTVGELCLVGFMGRKVGHAYVITRPEIENFRAGCRRTGRAPKTEKTRRPAGP